MKTARIIIYVMSMYVLFFVSVEPREKLETCVGRFGIMTTCVRGIIEMMGENEQTAALMLFNFTFSEIQSFIKI